VTNVRRNEYRSTCTQTVFAQVPVSPSSPNVPIQVLGLRLDALS
jgi:hypothetical protein